MKDLREGILELFDEAAEPQPAKLRYRWPLYAPRRGRFAQTKRERLAKYLAWQKADRARAKALRPVHKVEPLPFQMSCVVCRRGCHHEMHFAACAAVRAGRRAA